jgi:hypothetical protein
MNLIIAAILQFTDYSVHQFIKTQDRECTNMQITYGYTLD